MVFYKLLNITKMKEHIKKTYFFDELSEESKENAIENLYDINVDQEWCEFITENFKTENKYFEVTKVYFSGFGSQGDGAMFEYSAIKDELLHKTINDLKATNREKWVLKQGNIYGNGIQIGHYYHENSCSHTIDHNCFAYGTRLYEVVDKWFSEIEENIISEYKNMCAELYKTLEKEYDYLTSKEAIIETIEANDYEFLETGKLY